MKAYNALEKAQKESDAIIIKTESQKKLGFRKTHGRRHNAGCKDKGY